MKKTFKFMPGVFLTLTLCCCNTPKPPGETVPLPELPSVTVPAELDSIIGIKNWLAIGPFGFNPLVTDPLKTFAREDLKPYGIREGLLDDAALEKLQKKGAEMFSIEASSLPIRLFDHVCEDIQNKSNLYLASRIYSEKAQDATLIADGSYSYAVWLNGIKQVGVKGKYNTNKIGDRFVPVSLKKGENTLFVKINRGTNERSWDLVCAVAPRREAERIFRVNYANDFVVNPVIEDVLEVYAGPYTGGTVEVLDAEGQAVAGGSLENSDTNQKPFAVPGLKKLEDGFYKAVLTVGGKRLEEMIYRGDYRKFVKKMKADVAGTGEDSPYANDLKAALQRVEFLDGKPGDPDSPDETRFLDRNRVFWGYSLYKMLHGRDASTQLMTFRDEDGDPGVFIFHNGRKRQEKVPLAVVVPYTLQGNSMIEDWYTGNLDQMETDNALADEYGFAVAWIYAGGRQYSDGKTGKEIAAVINRLDSEGIIDREKVFITGDSEGGRRALLQVAATPERYAACAVSSPVTLFGEAGGISTRLLSQMGNVPLHIEHGTDDNVAPVENSRRFYAEAQKLNMPVEYVEVKGGHAGLSKDNHRYVYEFFSRTELKRE